MGKVQMLATEPRVLIVDDEDTIRSVIAQVLEEDGYKVTEAGSAEEALCLFRQDSFDLVITDIVMKKMSGIELLKEVRLLDPNAMVVVMTSHASVETATTALRSGAYDYLTKPFEDLDAITNVVGRAIDKIRLTVENNNLVEQLRRNTEELQDLNRSLTDMAMRDGLTGLHNHRFFREALDGELGRSERHGHEFSVLFMDVDHFKQYNDTHGHLAGDEVLKTLADLLSHDRRSSTIAARYGGEEFVLLIPETGRAGAKHLAEAVRRRVEQQVFPGGHTQPEGKVTLSIGVATYPEDGIDATSLIDAADKALYTAKASGRNRVC